LNRWASGWSGGANMAAGQRGWSDPKRWVLGIVGSVVGAVLVFLLIGPRGLLNPPAAPTPEPAAVPALSIGSFELPFPLTNDTNHTARFVVVNQGDAPATGCEMRGDVSPALGRQFLVPAGDSSAVEWGVLTYGRPGGTATLQAWVECANADSEAVYQEAVIVSFGQ
jgi:hypothetical protein